MDSPETLADYHIYPIRFNITDLEARRRLLEPVCREIIEGLPSNDRAVLLEYFTLLRERETWIQQTAYNTGIQIGERRAKRG